MRDLAIPFVTFMVLSKGSWRALFHKPTKRDVGTSLVFYVLTIAVSFGVALVVQSLTSTGANHSADGLAQAGGLEIAAFYVGTAIQLLGEEVFTMLPFLAIMYFFYKKGNLSRKNAILLAWLLSAVWFGAAHLPTYGWNVIQAFVIIASARLVMTLAYIRTKNLWVSYGTHLLNDWVIFTFIMLSSMVKNG